MKILFLLFIVSSICSSNFAQNKLLDILPTENGTVTYSGVVNCDSMTKEALYLKAKRWFIKTYNSGKDVIQLDDKENGEITGKGNFQIDYYARAPYISHTVSIYVKDGKYKYIISQFAYADNQNNNFPIEDFPNGWAGRKKLYTKVNDEVNLIIQSIDKAMQAKTNTDW